MHGEKDFLVVDLRKFICNFVRFFQVILSLGPSNLLFNSREKIVSLNFLIIKKLNFFVYTILRNLRLK